MPKCRMTVARTFLALLVVLVLGWLVAAASDPPDSEVNPVSGYIEGTDSTWEQSGFNVRHVTASLRPTLSD